MPTDVPATSLASFAPASRQLRQPRVKTQEPGRKGATETVHTLYRSAETRLGSRSLDALKFVESKALLITW